MNAHKCMPDVHALTPTNGLEDPLSPEFRKLALADQRSGRDSSNHNLEHLCQTLLSLVYLLSVLALAIQLALLRTCPERRGVLLAGHLEAMLACAAALFALNKAHCADALDLLRRLPSHFVQAVVADPPYYRVVRESWDSQWRHWTEYVAWCHAWVGQCMRVLRDDGLIFIFGQVGKREHVFLHLMSSLCLEHQFHDLIIWDRRVGANERRDSLTPCYEMVLALRKTDAVKFRKDRVRLPYDAKRIQAYLRDKRYKDRKARRRHLLKGKYATNILSVPSLKGCSNEKCGHPTQKPLDLIRKLILLSTDPGDIVLDPFLGSGTTAVAAEELRRSWLGIERESKYCGVIERRLAALKTGCS
jgi:site-specific DNA-methyltransferase (adenine-specific)